MVPPSRKIARPAKVLVLIPSYFDLLTASELADEIHQLDPMLIAPTVIVVDETLGLENIGSKSINFVRYENYFRMGAQSALVTALLSHRDQLQNFDFVCTMDGDGEDDPSDILKLLDAVQNGADVALATREKRHAPLSFKISRMFFQLVFLALTGIALRTGAFSVTTADWLNRNIQRPEFELSLSGALLALPASRKFVPCERAQRRKGKSRMRLTDSVGDGLRLLLPFAPKIAARSFLFFLIVVGIAIISCIWVAFVNIIGVATPGWTTSALVLVGTAVTASSVISLVTLGIMSILLLSGKQNIRF